MGNEREIPLTDPAPRHGKRYRCVFSYYGGKSKIVHLYPRPNYEWIIEPFCGAASYSAWHADQRTPWFPNGHRVWINDKDERTFSIWAFLQRPDAEEWLKVVPRRVTPGQRVSALLPADAPDGLRELLRAEANPGTQGVRGVRDQVTGFGAQAWHRCVPRIMSLLPLIRRWRITQLDYRDLPNIKATWFIDPPWSGQYGRRCRTTLEPHEYGELADWCRSRHGEVIVCEAVGASWLPFVPFTRGIGRRSEVAHEAIWVQGRDDNLAESSE
jgi:hypothetical protein